MERESTTPSPTRPGLALCLSGGGYRAAAFHLGVLDALDRLGLLAELRVLSTISGGTITGACWALARARGEPFPAFARRAYHTLATRHVVDEAFRLLARRDPEGRAPSLIRAAAEVYAGPEIAGAATLGALADAPALPDALVFGATEFRGGLAFRFQVDRVRDAVVGSGPRLVVPERVAREVRVADVVAASSCFPSAFEPLRFPDDFRWPRPLAEVRASLGRHFARPVPLMDGGVFDNQGVDGVLQTYRRWGAVADLLLVCDASPPPGTYLDLPAARRRGRVPLRALVWLGRLLFVGAVLSAATVGGALVARWRAGEGAWLRDLLVSGIPLLFSVAAAAALAWARWRFRRELRRVRRLTDVRLWPVLRRLTVPDVADLAEGRARSLVALASGVFMKRVRGLIQRSLVQDRRLRGRYAFNLLYDLLRPAPTLFAAAPWLAPSDALAALARRAAAVPTVLWPRGETELRELIACGQATTCFTLLRHLRAPDAPPAVGAVAAEAIAARARELWALLQERPTALVDGRFGGEPNDGDRDGGQGARAALDPASRATGRGS